MATLRRSTPPPPGSRTPVLAPAASPAGTQRPARSGPLAAIGRFVKRWTIPIIGGVTPVGLIVINVAVWINDHLQQERWFISIAAFVSGMILNSWVVLQVYRWVQQRWPHWGIVHTQNQEMALVVGMGVVTVYSFLSALACYIGLRDTQHLPNAFTLWWGALQIAIPFGLKLFFERAEKRAARRNLRSGTPVPPGADPASWRSSGTWRPGAPPSGTAAGNAPPGSGGYTPPGYLPPS